MVHPHQETLSRHTKVLLNALVERCSQKAVNQRDSTHRRIQNRPIHTQAAGGVEGGWGLDREVWELTVNDCCFGGCKDVLKVDDGDSA